MKKKNKSPLEKAKITDGDNPSLCDIAGNIRLRVHEDFFVETDLPKWKKFKADKEALLKTLNTSNDGLFGSRHYTLKDIKKSDIKKAVQAKELTPDQEKEITTKIEQLKLLEAVLKDDEWDIRGKHEKEVQAALEKNAWSIHVEAKSKRGRIARLFSRGPKLVPVDIAFQNLKKHMLLTSTEDLSQAKMAADELIQKYTRSGQFAKAAKVEELMPRIVSEYALNKAGYNRFVSEEQMIDFVKKSERGVLVNFLRYYEGEIPEDVLAKKEEADSKMIFDNYVVAYYSDIVRAATAAKKEQNKKEEEAVRAKRRDPILFGIIKHSRNLYYIADWVTPDDDLTLEKIKKCGISVGSLKETFSSKKTDSVYVAADPAESMTRSLSRLSDRMYTPITTDTTTTFTNYFQTNTEDGRSALTWG